MKLFEKIFSIVLISVPVLIVLILISCFAVSIFIKDSCDFHSSKTNWFEELIFDYNSSNGYHSEFSTGYCIFLTLLSLTLAYIFVNKFFRY